jgi:hypothetical protein
MTATPSPTVPGGGRITTNGKGQQTSSGNDLGGHTSGTNLIKCKQITYNMSDFLGSYVKLYQDRTHSHDVPLKTACTPFVEESGDDYGFGAAECEGHGNPVHAALAGEDITPFIIGSTLQDLAQSALGW